MRRSSNVVLGAAGLVLSLDLTAAFGLLETGESAEVAIDPIPGAHFFELILTGADEVSSFINGLGLAPLDWTPPLALSTRAAARRPVARRRRPGHGGVDRGAARSRAAEYRGR